MNTTSKFTRNIGLVIFLGALISGCTTNPSNPSQELSNRVASARTAADHESLAAYYESEAGKSKVRADQYRRSSANWRAGNPRERIANVSRYDSVIKEYDDDAAKFANLAAEQRAKACELSPGSTACKPATVTPKN